MTINLVTDSTCDLPPALMQALAITAVPIHIQFGAESYRENETITAADFYPKVAAAGQLPTTSQPAVNDFAETYTHLASQADELLSIHLTSKLSGTYHSAKTAANLVADQIPVTVIDSLAGSAGLGWMLHEAATLIAQGLSTRQIQARLEQKRPRISLYFAIDTLDYAVLSGRVGKLSSVMGTLLNIKPIIGLENGLIEVQDKVRSNKAANARIIALTQQKVGEQPINLAIVHAQALNRAEALMHQAKEIFNIQEAYIKDVAISLAVHFGPGTVGLIAYPTE